MTIAFKWVVILLLAIFGITVVVLKELSVSTSLLWDNIKNKNIHNYFETEGKRENKTIAHPEQA